jgi:hypothetical protein
MPPPAMRPAPEPVPPDDPDASRGDVPPGTARPTNEPAPEGASLYGTGRSASLSESAPECSPGSAYRRAPSAAVSEASVQASPSSLYSGLSARTAPATWWEAGQNYERPAVSNDTPDEIEIVPPPVSRNMNR